MLTSLMRLSGRFVALSARDRLSSCDAFGFVRSRFGHTEPFRRAQTFCIDAMIEYLGAVSPIFTQTADLNLKLLCDEVDSFW